MCSFAHRSRARNVIGAQSDLPGCFGDGLMGGGTFSPVSHILEDACVHRALCGFPGTLSSTPSHALVVRDDFFREDLSITQSRAGASQGGKWDLGGALPIQAWCAWRPGEQPPTQKPALLRSVSRAVGVNSRPGTARGPGDHPRAMYSPSSRMLKPRLSRQSGKVFAMQACRPKFGSQHPRK